LNDSMKRSVLIVLMAACAAVASAQTQPDAAASTTKPATTATKPAPAATAQKSAKPAASSAAKPAGSAAASATAAAKPAAAIKLPYGVPAPGIPPVKTVKKTAFSLQYQEIKVGAGAEAESNKLYKVQYTGWLAADGHKFDSSYDHPRPPVTDKDGKPVLDADGKPKQGDPQPMPFPQGMGRVIPGFDQGFTGMKIGGKRRIFIPWQLAYGAKGRPGPDAEHPGIPPKADLIFDVELVDISDLPTPPRRPGMGGMPPGRPMPGGAMPPRPATPGASAPSAAPATPDAPANAAKPATPAATTAPAAPAAPATGSPAPAPATPAPATAPAAPAATPAPSAPAQPQSK